MIPTSHTTIPSVITSQSLLSDADETYQHKDKTFAQRAFSPMHAGAMRGSIFALLASSMGTGMFNLSYRINQIGIFPYILFILAAGLFSHIGMYLLSRLIHKFRVESYSDMCERSYGTVFRKVAEFCLVIYPWGITVCFQVIFAKFVVQLLADTFGLELYQEGDGRQQ
jgi:amino acid permease